MITELSNNDIKRAVEHYSEFMDILFPNWKDDPHMRDTPNRVVKSYVKDLCKSLYTEPPAITAFENEGGYDGIVLQSKITLKSLCAHHFQNIYGEAHVAYIPDPKGKIVGLSKLNRIVDYHSHKPTVQESLCKTIHDDLVNILTGNKGVAVIINAKHNCVSHRGINDPNSIMSTAVLSGAFKEDIKVRDELYKLIEMSSK